MNWQPIILLNELLDKQVSLTVYIALATVNRAAYLTSWNFKHIVNVKRIRGYNSINIKNRYKELEKSSPGDFMIYEDFN